jgi:EAL domain-containing protein (putative c-di-GMP-specific phosphodiesterase class I)
MTSSNRDAVIVRSIVVLGRNLGLRVVAEGVEDHATWSQLDALGCDAIQSYDVSRPDDLIDSLEQQAATPIRSASKNAGQGTNLATSAVLARSAL